MKYLVSSLRETCDEDQLYILATERNSGSYTYDGVELGGERVTQEVEQTLEMLEKRGQKIKKISFVGYSMGGLISRYAIGLLYRKGWFDKLEPVVSVIIICSQPLLMLLVELHNLRDASPGNSDTQNGVQESIMERLWSSHAGPVWKTALHGGHLPGHW